MPTPEKKPTPTSPVTTPRVTSAMSTRRYAKTRDESIPSVWASIGSFVFEVLKILIIALLIIKPIHYFILQPFYVRGASMEPNFYNNEYLIVDELSYRFHTPRRGDVVVIHNPYQASEYFIKRVIGLPGEQVIIGGGQVRIVNTDHPQGWYLDELTYLSRDVVTTGDLRVTLGADQYYVLGDNRPASLDSRSFGPITKKDIVGRTAVRAWPLNRARLFPTPSTPLEPLPIQ